jgi:hypothetical protein
MLLRETQNLDKDFRRIARKTNPKPTAPQPERGSIR